MDKPNVFRTSEFYMSEGDTLHVSIKYADGSDTVDLDLVAGDSGVVSDSTTYRVVDKDGNIYRTVIIGNQEWIVENLKVTTYADDSPIANLTVNVDWTGDTTGAYCYYNNDITNKADYGALYNWYAVDNAAGLVYLERNGVSETDWRVPTKADWLSLTTLLGGNAVAGGKLKSVGYDYFDVPNTGATDEYGFRGRAGGSRSTTGVFTGLRTNGNHHQSDLSTGNYVSRVLFSSFTSLGSTTALNGNGGYSVRLVRDI